VLTYNPLNTIPLMHSFTRNGNFNNRSLDKNYLFGLLNYLIEKKRTRSNVNRKRRYIQFKGTLL
jgi:hypothetical protein